MKKFCRALFSLALITREGLQAIDQGLPFQADVKSPRIEALRKRIRGGDKDAVKRFWSDIENQGTPLIEKLHDPDHVLVTFLYRSSSVQGVQLSAQLTTLRDDRSMNLHPLSGSDVWYKTFGFVVTCA